MERITLTNLHEQLDSLRSTSLPQVKKYFRKRIVKYINECKTQALSMKKSIEPNINSSHQEILNPNDYEFGWGSDFDEDDEDDDEQCLQSKDHSDTSSRDVNNVQSLSSLHIDDTTGQALSHLTHSVSLQAFDCLETSTHLSTKGSCWSSPASSIRRPISEPPPPPLPKEPPPNVMDDKLAGNRPCKPGISEDAYEIMSPSTSNCDDEYLLPNSSLKPAQYLACGSQDNANYEYIQYNQIDGPPANSSDSASIQSNLSRSNFKFDNEVISDRPLPPIPKEENFEDLMISNFSWFHNLERDDAERLLKRMDTDGVYLVRKSRRAGASNPYTLTLFHNGRIFHLNVRKRIDSRYALGKEKHKEKTFASVVELVEHHNTEPILLTSKGQAAGKTRLIYTPSGSATSSANHS